MSNKLKITDILIWVLNLGLPAAIMMIPTSEIFSPTMRLFLAVTILAILMIAFGKVSQSMVTLALPISYVLLGIAGPDVAWSSWSKPTVWMVIGGMLMVTMLKDTGLLTRISYKIVLATGGSYKGIILGIGITGCVLSIILFGNGYLLMAGLALGLCEALELPKFSREATGIFLAAAVAGIVPTVTFYGSSVIMCEGYAEAITGPMHISWTGWTFMNLPIIFYYVLTLVLIMFLFPSKKEISGREYLQKKSDELGKMTLMEKKACFWVVVMLTWVIYAGIAGGNATYAFIVVPILMLLPGIGCGNEEQVKNVDFGFVLFLTACMSIGFVAGSLGFGMFVSTISAPLVASATPTAMLLMIYVFNIVVNFLLTPMAIMAGFTSTFVQIGMNAGINPYVIFDMIMMGSDQILFPYEYLLYMFYFSFGFVSMKDFVKYFGAKMILCSIVILLVAIPFWRITGLLMM